MNAIKIMSANGHSQDGYKKCPVCKRKFYMPEAGEWAYKKATRSGYWYYCSWKCLREYEKKASAKNKNVCKYCNKEKSQNAFYSKYMCWECKTKRAAECKRNPDRKAKTDES